MSVFFLGAFFAFLDIFLDETDFVLAGVLGGGEGWGGVTGGGSEEDNAGCSVGVTSCCLVAWAGGGFGGGEGNGWGGVIWGGSERDNAGSSVGVLFVFAAGDVMVGHGGRIGVGRTSWSGAFRAVSKKNSSSLSLSNTSSPLASSLAYMI